MQKSDALSPSDPVRSAEGLLSVVYDELRRLARHYMAKEQPGHMLESAALVNEAFLRIVADHGESWANRRQFFSAAAEAMRRILVEDARKRGRLRRGGQHQRISLSGVDLAASDDPDRVLAMDEVLQRFAQANARAAEIVRLRFYAGLDEKETATVLGLSERSVRREWAHARAWLLAALGATG